MSENIWNAAMTDSTQQDVNEYPVADAGTYEFEVVSAKGKEHLAVPGGKIGHCAEIDLQMRFEAKVNGVSKDVMVFDRLYADPSTIWKMTAFAKAVGIYQDGMTAGDMLKMISGNIGKAEIGIREYKGKKQNEVKKYIAQKGSDLPF